MKTPKEKPTENSNPVPSPDSTPSTVEGVPIEPPKEKGAVTDAPETLESIAAHVDEKSPEPNEPAIIHATEKQNRRGEGQTGKKRGSYKGGSKSQVSETKSAEQNEIDEKCYAAGAETIDALVNFAAGTMGPEWGWMATRTVKLPNGNEFQFDERERGQRAFGRLYVHYGWGEPSPLMAVSMFCVAYFGVRLRNPEVKAKATQGIDKIKLWFAENRMKRERARQEKQAREILENSNKDSEKK